jgi:hypothetical protein
VSVTESITQQKNVRGSFFIVRVFLFLFAVAVACPIRYWPVSRDLDNSWLVGLNYAAAHGLVMGRDVLATTGPLAYLASPQDIGKNLEYGLWFQTALWIVLLGVLFDVYFRTGFRLRNLALFTMFLSLSAPLFWFNRVGLENLLLAAALVCVVVYRGQGGIPRLLTALVLTGIMSLIKFTSAFIAAGAMAGFLIERILVLRRRARSEVILVILVPALVVGISLLATMPADALGAFLKTAAEMSGGYSVSMSFPGPVNQFFGALATLVLVGLLLLVNARAGRVPTIFLALLLAVPLAVSLKHGFVRQDVHIINFFCFCALALALIALSIHLKGWRVIAAEAIVFSFLWFWLDNVAHYLEFRTAAMEVTGMGAVQLAWRLRDLPQVRQDLLRQAEHDSIESLRIEPDLRAAIGNTPVGFLANSFGLALVLDKVKIALIPPIFPSDAYTPYLDGVCAQWVREKGPRFLLFDGSTIDRRNIWAEVPATWNEVYRWYDSRMLGKYYLLLERRAKPRFFRMISLGRSVVALKDGFTLPAAEGVVFWTMKCSMSTTGKLNKLLFRVPVLMMDAETRDRNYLQFRVLPDQVVQPVIGSMPSKVAEFARIFDPAGKSVPAMKRLAFGKSSFSQYEAADAALASYEPTCEIEFMQPEK